MKSFSTRTARHLLMILGAVALLGLTACGEDDPEATPPANNSTPTNNNTNNDTNNPVNNTNNDTNNPVNNINNDTNNPVNNTNNDTNNVNNTPVVVDETMVAAECILPTDYSPGAEDTWAACISDDNTYHPFEMSISTASRIAAFEEIADLLWRNGTPDMTDFLDAREAYAVAEGLDSRVSRREDEHYPPVSDGAGGTLSCRDEGVPAMDPDRCVGPAQMIPLLNDAFMKGSQGMDPEINAARIEATLLWFLLLSVHKEATTCTAVKKDCDSAYAYYTGDQPRTEAIGLAGYIAESAPATHDRVWDGILAVRCWRDLDSADLAVDLAQRDLALDQTDRALLYGFSRIIIDRIEAMMGHTGTQRAADWAFLQIMGKGIDREATERDATRGAALRTAFTQANPDGVDLDAVVMDLYTIFDCQ